MSFDRTRLPDAADYFEGQGLRLTGRGKWRSTACSFHGGSDSMRVNVASGAFRCMNCGARGGNLLAYFMAEHGVDFVTAAKALGAWVDDGKPGRPQRPTPLPATEAIRLLAFESNLVAVAAGNLAHGVKLGARDLARLFVAARRIQHVAEVFA